MSNPLTGPLKPSSPRQDDRAHVRVTPNQSADVRLRVERGAQVVDASNGGVGLVIDHPWGIRIGERVLLWSDDDHSEPIDYAIVKNVRLLDDGRWRIGLQWGDIAANDSDAEDSQ